MIVTATDMYKYYLDGINKEHTASTSPTEFNRLINLTQTEWIKNKYVQVEMTEKRIDDLRILQTRDEIINTGTLSPTNERFLLPYDPDAPVITPGNPNGDNNGYMFLLACAFKIQYIDNECKNKGISDWLKSKTMKTNFELEIMDDPYNKPKDDRLYHKIQGNEILCYTGTSSYAVEARIDYIRYPREINVPVPSAATEVNCELPLHAREEIVQIAVRKEINRIESPRYQQQIVENSQTIT